MRNAGGGVWLHRAAAAALVLGVGVFSYVRAAQGQWDFSHFYHDALTAWRFRGLDDVIDPTGRDEGRRLPFYLPAVPALLAPLGGLSLRWAALAWAGMQAGSLAAALYLLRKRWVADCRALTWVVVLALPAIYEAAKFNQLSFPILALALVAFDAFERRRTAVGAAALGLAVVLKLLPGLLVIWLALKRKWAAAAATLAAATVLAVVPPLVVFGPQRAVEYHLQWWDFNVHGDAARGLLNVGRREHFTDHRNQSITQVLSRWTWPGHPYPMPIHPLVLDESTVVVAGGVVATLILLALLATTARPWPRLAEERRAAEWAVYCIAMLALSPLVRQYYLVWALPALASLIGIASGRGPTRRRFAAGTGLLVWALGMAAWMSPIEAWGRMARLGGAHLIMLFVIGGLLLAATTTRRNQRGRTDAQ